MWARFWVELDLGSKIKHDPCVVNFPILSHFPDPKVTVRDSRAGAPLEKGLLKEESAGSTPPTSGGGGSPGGGRLVRSRSAAVIDIHSFPASVPPFVDFCLRCLLLAMFVYFCLQLSTSVYVCLSLTTTHLQVFRCAQLNVCVARLPQPSAPSAQDS